MGGSTSNLGPTMPKFKYKKISGSQIEGRSVVEKVFEERGMFESLPDHQIMQSSESFVLQTYQGNVNRTEYTHEDGVDNTVNRVNIVLDQSQTASAKPVSALAMINGSGER